MASIFGTLGTAALPRLGGFGSQNDQCAFFFFFFKMSVQWEKMKVQEEKHETTRAAKQREHLENAKAAQAQKAKKANKGVWFYKDLYNSELRNWFKLCCVFGFSRICRFAELGVFFTFSSSETLGMQS